MTSCAVERVSADLPGRSHSGSTHLADHTTFRLGGPARKIVRGGEGGYLSVVLTPGKRAVSVPVSTDTAAYQQHVGDFFQKHLP